MTVPIRSPHGGARFDKWAERSVQECFTEITGQWSADQIAIAGTEGDLSYGELGRLSDAIAQALILRRGLRPEPVAVLLEHGSPAPAAMLGVLKAGKFFVFLDPSYPVDRNHYVLEDSEAAVVIVSEATLPLSSSLGITQDRLLNLDEARSRSATDYRRVRSAPDDLAYVLYTSGSTGQPKGVMRTHRGLLHNVVRGSTTRQVSSTDRIALLFSYSFSAAIGNVFTSLLNGATLLPFNLKEQGAAALADWLIDREITQFHTVPTVFRHFLDSLSTDRIFPQLRLIQLGGETMFGTDVERFRQQFGDRCLLVVGMGTSETGHIFEFRIDAHTECPTGVLPVGYAVKGTEVLLLDAHGQPVGTGEVGEIAVRGNFVSPGYWRRPELTAKKFRSEPGRGNARTYLTGDLGRMLRDGCVFHLGRNDARVRIRGQSVEIPELEAALLLVPGVREAAVTVQETGTREPRLVACIVPSKGAKMRAATVRETIGERLPAYMVPSAFVMLDALPLLPNGKIDRQALLAFGQTRSRDEHYRAPRTAIEAWLTRTWSDALGIERVGIGDNFFDLGGHSLQAMRLLVRIEKTFGKRLPITTLFEAPTVEKFAVVLNQRPEGSAPATLVALQPGGSKPPFFWIHGEDSNAFLPRYLGQDQPVYGLLEQSWDGRPARYTTVEDIAAHHIRNISAVQPHGPYFLGGYCFGGILAFEIAQQLQKQGEEVGFLAMVDPNYFVAGRAELQNVERRAVRHLRSLSSLAPDDTIRYVTSRMVNLARQWMQAMTARAQRLASRVYIATGMTYTTPPAMRIRYILTIHRRAKRAYVRHVYGGRVLVFQTNARRSDPRAVWEKFAGGGLEVHELAGEHEGIVNDDAQIRGFARELKTHLEKAQSASGLWQV